MDANKYAVNYDDERLTSVKQEESQKIQETNQTYGQMINNSDKFYQDQIQASKDYAQQQQQLQQQNTDFAIEKIEQQREQTQKDYIKEQKGAYNDYANQINDYGINAEKMAANGLSNSGYSESSKVSMYNTYQNRIATARESLNNAEMNYNNSIKEAQLANNSKLAEIAQAALQQQLELSLQGFQYKNSLIEAKQAQLNYIGQRYDTKYQNVLAQINEELNRQQRIDELLQEMQFKTKQFEEQSRQWEKEYALKQEQWRKEDARADAELALARAKTKASLQALTISDNDNSYKKTISTDSNPTAATGATAALIAGILGNATNLGGGKVRDNKTGKVFSSTDKLLEYYGYAVEE